MLSVSEHPHRVILPRFLPPFFHISQVSIMVQQYNYRTQSLSTSIALMMRLVNTKRCQSSYRKHSILVGKKFAVSTVEVLVETFQPTNWFKKLLPKSFFFYLWSWQASLPFYLSMTLRIGENFINFANSNSTLGQRRRRLNEKLETFHHWKQWPEAGLEAKFFNETF